MLSEPVVGSSKSNSQLPDPRHDDLHDSAPWQYSGEFTDFRTICSRPHAISQVDKIEGAILHLHLSCVDL